MDEGVMEKMADLTPKKFDAAMSAATSPVIWTAKAIGQKIGRSESWVRKVLAKIDGTPVQRTRGGNLYVAEDDLMRFFRGQHPN